MSRILLICKQLQAIVSNDNHIKEYRCGSATHHFCRVGIGSRPHDRDGIVEVSVSSDGRPCHILNQVRKYRNGDSVIEYNEKDGDFVIMRVVGVTGGRRVFASYGLERFVAFRRCEGRVYPWESVPVDTLLIL